MDSPPARVRTRPAGPAGLVATALATVLAACGGSGRGPPRTPPPPVEPVPEAGLLASGISYLPPELTSARRYRPNLAIAGGEVVFSDGSATPLRVVPAAGGEVRVLAERMGPAGRVAARDGVAFWAVDGALVEADLLTSRRRVLATGNGAPTPDLLVDPAAAYWVRRGAGWQVERVTDRGASALATRGQKIAGLAQDATRVYWVEDAVVPISTACDCGSSVRAVSKSGGTPAVLVDGALNAPIPDLGGYVPAAWRPVGGVATDGAHVYFARIEVDAIRIARVPVGGGGIEPVAEVPFPGAADATLSPRRLAVGATRLYWIDATRLAAAPLAGGAVEVLASDLSSPVDLVVDDAAAFVAEAAGGWEAGRVRRFPLAGGAATTPLSGLDVPAALALDGGRFYWSEAWRVAAAPRGSGPAATLATGITDPYFRVLLRGDDVLVLDGPLLRRIPRAGGALEKVLVTRDEGGAPVAFAAEDVTADAAALYLVERSWARPHGAWRIPLDGGAVTRHGGSTIGAPQDCMLRVAVDATHVYWTDGSTTPVFCTVARAPLAGGPPEIVADAPLLDFAVAGGDVYFTEGTVRVMDGAGWRTVGSDSLNLVPAGGGPLVTEPFPGFPFLVVVAGERVVWLDPLGTIKWTGLDLAGYGAFAVGDFLETSLHADALATDGAAVYWTNVGLGALGKLWFP